MGLKSAELLNGEITLTASGFVAGGIPIKFNRGNGIFQTAAVYAKASSNGLTVLIPINSLASEFGYQDYRVSGTTTGSKIILERVAGDSEAIKKIANIELTLGSTQYLLRDSSDSSRNGWQLSQSAPESDGMTLYVPMDMLALATGVQYRGNASTGVEISPPVS